MAWLPISGLVTEHTRNAAGNSASGYWLKFYADGTSSPIAMATAPAGTPTIAKAKLNSRGEPLSNPSDDDSVFVPYLNQNYKAALFLTEADADANDTNSALWVIDNLGMFDYFETLEDAIGANRSVFVAKTLANAKDASGPLLFNGYRLTPDDIADLANTGALIETSVNNTTSNKGGAKYFIKTLAQHRLDIGSPTWVPDNVFIDHYLLGGTTYVAVLDVVNEYKITQVGGIGDGSDETDLMIALCSVMTSGKTIDFEGLEITIVHKGTDFDPVDDGVVFRTSYIVFENLNNIVLKNGTIKSSLDMTSNSMMLVSFFGCYDVSLQNMHLNLSCSGYPVFLNNGYETHGTLVNFSYHPTGNAGGRLHVDSRCRFRVNHPDGFSIGDGTGNPVHPTYAGKLEGILFWGGFSATTPVWMDDLIIESGVEFYECTARTIWCWQYRDVTIGDITFRKCGLLGSSTERMYFGVRLIHGGRNIKIGRLQFVDCNLFSGVYLTNNNGPWFPENVVVEAMQFSNCEGGIGGNTCFIADGQNVTIGPIQQENSPLERGFQLATAGGNNQLKNLTVSSISANGLLGRLVTVLGNVRGHVSINHLYAEDNGTQNMSGIYGVYLEGYNNQNDSSFEISNFCLKGFQSGIYTDATTSSPIKVTHGEISNSISNGIAHATLSAQNSYYEDIELHNNGAIGMRCNRGSVAKNIRGSNNVGLMVELMNNATLDGFTVDDGPDSAGSGVGILAGESGWTFKNGTLRSTSGNFVYGISASQTGSILYNQFIGTVGTTAKWTTFGGSTVLYNTPNDTP